MDNVEISPLRPLDDFLFGGARFQLPNLKDPERCANRVINNLLYYQTNYFLTAVIIFLLVGIMHPVQMLLGVLAVMGAFTLFVYVSDNQAQFRTLKKQHPGLSVVVIMLVGYLAIWLFGSVIVFLFGIAMPMLVILIHAGLRLRNIKNKISNKMEFVGLKRTPMGLLLEALGQESEAGS